jgi:hypothetical protein
LCDWPGTGCAYGALWVAMCEGEMALWVPMCEGEMTLWVAIYEGKIEL